MCYKLNTIAQDVLFVSRLAYNYTIDSYIELSAYKKRPQELMNSIDVLFINFLKRFIIGTENMQVKET